MQSRRISRVGVVVSDKMDKTVVVSVERQFKHPLYKKTVRKHKRFKAHDEQNDCRKGDKVVITECRPISRDKTFVITEILERSK